MKNTFYIISNEKGDHFQLREKEGHRVISTSGNLDTLLANLFIIAVRYRCSDNIFYRRMRNTNDRRGSEKTLLIHKKEYEEVGDMYSEYIEEVIDKAEKEVEELQPINQIRKNIKKIKAQPKEISKEKRNKGELTISPFNIKYGEIKLYSI